MPEAIDRYALPPDDPRQLNETIRDLERRISELEGRNPMAAGAEVRDGSVIFKAADGTVLLEISTANGFEVWNTNGQQVFRVGPDGQEYPHQWLYSLLVDLWQETTNAAYTDLFRTDFSCTAGRVDYDFQIDPNGSTMDYRLTIEEFSGTTTVPDNEITGLPVSGTGVVAGGQIAGYFHIPAACLTSGTDPVGRQMTMRLDARRTAGATPVRMRLNAPFTNRPI